MALCASLAVRFPATAACACADSEQALCILLFVSTCPRSTGGRDYYGHGVCERRSFWERSGCHQLLSSSMGGARVVNFGSSKTRASVAGAASSQPAVIRVEEVKVHLPDHCGGDHGVTVAVTNTDADT